MTTFTRFALYHLGFALGRSPSARKLVGRFTALVFLSAIGLSFFSEPYQSPLLNTSAANKAAKAGCLTRERPSYCAFVQAGD
jgi:hypothetical protein